MPWHPFHDGLTIGTSGSEGGVILRDEEHPLGARITLERVGGDGRHAVTCGVYGLMLHTAFADGEAAGVALYGTMRERLLPIAEALSDEESVPLAEGFVSDFS